MPARYPRALTLGLGVLVVAFLVGIGAVGALLLDGDSSQPPSLSVQANEAPGGTPAANAPTGKGYLGLTVMVVPIQGLRVASVVPGGPAASAGIQVGDVIRAVNGQVVRTPEQLKAASEAGKPGSDASITYERSDRSIVVSVKLGDAPANAQVEATPAGSGQPGPAANAPGAGRPVLGLQVAAINPQLKQQYNLDRDAGVVVTAVQPNTPAMVSGFRPGDVLVAIGDQPVATVNDATRVIAATMLASRPVTVKVNRGGADQAIQVTPASATVPGLENLPPELQLAFQRGTLPPEALAQLQRLLNAYPGNNIRLGKVDKASDTSVSITPLEGGTATTFAVNSLTQVRRGAAQLQPKDLAAGTTVLVLSTDGTTATAVIAFGS